MRIGNFAVKETFDQNGELEKCVFEFGGKKVLEIYRGLNNEYCVVHTPKTMSKGRLGATAEYILTRNLDIGNGITWMSEFRNSGLIINAKTKERFSPLIPKSVPDTWDWNIEIDLYHLPRNIGKLHLPRMVNGDVHICSTTPQTNQWFKKNIKPDLTIVKLEIVNGALDSHKITNVVYPDLKQVERISVHESAKHPKLKRN